MFSDKLKNNDNPTVTYQGDKDVSFCLITDQCGCADSSFWGSHHKYIIAGNLRIIKNSKLRKLLTKSPNYREPRTINFSKALIDVTIALDTCTESMTLKTKYATSNFKPWKETVLTKVEKNNNLNKKSNLNKQNQYWVINMLKSSWKNSTKNLLLSPLKMLHFQTVSRSFPK